MLVRVKSMFNSDGTFRVIPWCPALTYCINHFWQANCSSDRLLFPQSTICAYKTIRHYTWFTKWDFETYSDQRIDYREYQKLVQSRKNQKISPKNDLDTFSATASHSPRPN
jgi:hypothetical protein